MLTTIKRVVLACGVLAALGVASPALADTQRSHAGDVTASFSFTGSPPNVRHQTLTIRKAGTVAYHQPVTARFCGTYCGPGSLNSRQPSVQVVNLEGTATPQVVLNLYSGGAHCCFVVEVFAYDAAKHTFVMSQRNLGDPGADLRDLGHTGRYEFVTQDDRFAYEFTDYADSGRPIQILAFRHGRFADVTRQYPALIAADAAAWLKAYKSMATSHWTDSVGLFAAWAADEALLGNESQAYAYATQQAKAGHLHSSLLPHTESGTAFVSSLQMFLDHTGYVVQMCGGG